MQIPPFDKSPNTKKKDGTLRQTDGINSTGERASGKALNGCRLKKK
mgnify:CR=1 FL=1